MTTHNNTPTRSTTNAHKGQTIADTNPTQEFKVNLILARRSAGRMIISAANSEEARKKAGQLNLCDIDNWEVYEDELTIESVEAVDRGESHD